jgi:hypothetical protein
LIHQRLVFYWIWKRTASPSLIMAAVTNADIEIAQTEVQVSHGNSVFSKTTDIDQIVDRVAEANGTVK